MKMLACLLLLSGCVIGAESHPGDDDLEGAGDPEAEGEPDEEEEEEEETPPDVPPPVDCGELATPDLQGTPFTLCASPADCPWPQSDLCYKAAGAETGFCQRGDADIWCDGEGDVNVRTVPALEDWGPGMCAPHEWRDFMCCRWPDEWECPA